MTIQFAETIFVWRGPAPHFFVAMPLEQSLELKAIANFITYGWGVIPAQVRIGTTVWQTSLIPKDGLYLVPLKASIRKAEQLSEGDLVMVEVEIAE